MILPETGKVMSVTVTVGERVREYSDPGWISDFISMAAESEPTSLQSVSDTPSAAEYVRVDICLGRAAAPFSCTKRTAGPMPSSPARACS